MKLVYLFVVFLFINKKPRKVNSDHPFSVYAKFSEKIDLLSP